MRRSLLVLATAVLLGALPLPGDLDARAEAAPRSKSKAVKVRSRRAPPSIKVQKPEEQESTSQEPQASAAPPTRGPTRIDFDDRLIQGQTNRSGSVYLYDRKELKTRSMVKKRESFRDEIVSSVYDD